MTTEEKLKNVNIKYVKLGNGKTVVNQYPKKDTKILVGSKMFIKTEDNNYTLPDVTGYTKSELIALCHLLNINFKINGNGKVVSSSLNYGSMITEEQITFNLA